MQTAFFFALVLAAFFLARLDVRFNLATWPEQKASPVLASIVGILFIALALAAAYHVYAAIQTWHVKCIGRECVGQYSAAVDPLKYWGTVALWYAAFVISLSTLVTFKRVHFSKRSEP